MKLKLKQAILSCSFFWLGCTIAFFSVLYLATQRVLATLPEETRSCLPRQGLSLAAANPQLFATASSASVDYHLYYLQEDAQEYVVMVGQNAPCKLLKLSPKAALSSQVPLPVAKQLTLIKLQKAIARVGKPELKRQMQQLLQATTDRSLSPELSWAIKELGLR
jgi:hypothetical protein